MEDFSNAADGELVDRYQILEFAGDYEDSFPGTTVSAGNKVVAQMDEPGHLSTS